MKEKEELLKLSLSRRRGARGGAGLCQGQFFYTGERAFMHNMQACGGMGCGGSCCLSQSKQQSQQPKMRNKIWKFERNCFKHICSVIQDIQGM